MIAARIVLVSFREEPGWGTTWYGIVREQTNSGWTEQYVRELTAHAYNKLLRTRRTEKTIVTILWVKGQGVHFSSIPHCGGQERLSQLCQTINTKGYISWQYPSWRRAMALQGQSCKRGFHPFQYHQGSESHEPGEGVCFKVERRGCRPILYEELNLRKTKE
jgi:hypothetical protein